MRNHIAAPSVTIAMNPSPPTTPPAIAPSLDFDLLDDAVGVKIIAGEADAEAADAEAADAEAADAEAADAEADAEAADAEAAEAEAVCSAATTLKLLPVRVRSRNAQLGTST